MGGSVGPRAGLDGRGPPPGFDPPLYRKIHSLCLCHAGMCIVDKRVRRSQLQNRSKKNLQSVFQLRCYLKKWSAPFQGNRAFGNAVSIVT